MTPFSMNLESAAAQATGWALVHFLWQGTIVALIAASALRLMNRQSANARYLVACVSLLVLAAFPLATGWSAYEQSPARSFHQIDQQDIHRSVAPDSAKTSRTFLFEPISQPRLQRIQSALRPRLPWFVGAWFAGVALLSIRLLTGCFAAQRLCRTASDASSRWQRTLGNLSERMNLGARVRLLESSRVDVPMVIGWLRPVVLVPLTAMTGLSPEQLETILAHELAHIRRHDYLVNVLQSVVEILFFYHPAVWWLSNRIRLERENCCDDVAIGVCGNPLLYARALAELEELRSTGSPAVAVSGGSLRERVTRLVSYPRIQCSYRWVTGVSILSLFAALAVAAPLTLLAQQSKKKNETEKTRTESSVTIVEDEQTDDPTDDPTDDDIDVYADEATDEAGSSEVADDDGQESTTERTYIVSDDDDVDVDDEEMPVAPLTPLPPTPPSPPPGQAPRDPLPPMVVVGPSPHTAPAATPPPPPRAPRVPGVAPVAPVAATAPALAPAAPRIPGTPRLAPLAPVRVGQAKHASKDRKRENDRWDGKLTVDQLIELRTSGVDAAYINELRKLGYGNLSFDDLIALRLHGVGPEYIASMNAYGFGHLTADQLIELRNQGVTPGFIDEMKKLGYGSVPVDEFISLRVQGVTPEYVKQMNGAGFGRISTGKLVEMRIHGVDPIYIGQLAAAGYPKLTLDDLIELRIQGVTAAFIKTLKEAGLDKLDVDEIIRLRNSGVDPEFIREMSRYKTQ